MSNTDEGEEDDEDDGSREGWKIVPKVAVILVWE
jgi:hypothetical protein